MVLIIADVDDSKLYTQPEEVAYAYEELVKLVTQFTIAAAFGNVHGVYKPGNVKLTPKILKNSQEYISKNIMYLTTTIDFVFHGGSGSTVEEIREAIGYGVIKMNIDTDMQYAFMSGIRDYMGEKEAYLAHKLVIQMVQILQIKNITTQENGYEKEKSFVEDV